MRWDWVPVSAALLITGSMALAAASLVAEATDSAADLLRSVESHDGRWLAAAAGYLLASICLTLGLPSVLVLLRDRGRTVGAVGAVLLAIGFIGLAGYGMVVTFFRALVIADAVDPVSVGAVTGEAGLSVVLLGWLVAFVLGELLVTVALFRSGTVPGWVPAMLAVHLATVALDVLLPETVTRVATLLFALGFSGVGIAAATPARARLA